MKCGGSVKAARAPSRLRGRLNEAVSRARRSTKRGRAKWCAADPGSLRAQSLGRSRISDAPFHAASHPGNGGLLMPFEILHRTLVLLGGGAAIEGAQIAAAAGLRVHIARIEPVFAGGQLADHGVISRRRVYACSI